MQTALRSPPALHESRALNSQVWLGSLRPRAAITGDAASAA
jgi:hypothetical protein